MSNPNENQPRENRHTKVKCDYCHKTFYAGHGFISMFVQVATISIYNDETDTWTKVHLRDSEVCSPACAMAQVCELMKAIVEPPQEPVRI